MLVFPSFLENLFGCVLIRRFVPWSFLWSNRKGEEEKEKLQVSLQIKGKLTFGEEKDTITSKILFDVNPFSPPPSYHFRNPFQNHWERFLIFFGPSFSLAIYMTWVVPFSFTHELHIFSF
jgi:hypothetical protein